MVITQGKMIFENVPSSNMPLLLQAVHTLSLLGETALYVYVQCIGATRQGDIVTIDTTWGKLLDHDASKRKQFFNLMVNGVPTLIRPNKDMFTSVRIDIDKE